MKPIHALALVIAMLVTLSADAFAWLKFHNDTSNDVWVATVRTSEKGCLEPYCPTQKKWIRKGWWKIAPNGTATVYSDPWGEGFWKFYAEDQFGHVWAGDPNSSTDPVVCTPQTPFSGCTPVACQSDPDNCTCAVTGETAGRSLRYRTLNSWALCGGWCTSGCNHTVNLIL